MKIALSNNFKPYRRRHILTEHEAVGLLEVICQNIDRLYRIVVSTSRCGRENLGSNPSIGTFLINLIMTDKYDGILA